MAFLGDAEWDALEAADSSPQERAAALRCVLAAVQWDRTLNCSCACYAVLCCDVLCCDALIAPPRAAPPRPAAGAKSSQACCELRIRSAGARAAAAVVMEAVTWALNAAGYKVAFLAMGNEGARELYGGDKVDKRGPLRERYGVVQAGFLRADLRALSGVQPVSYFVPHALLWKDKLARR
jgi:hypothetical protein